MNNTVAILEGIEKNKMSFDTNQKLLYALVCELHAINDTLLDFKEQQRKQHEDLIDSLPLAGRGI